jgi:hypothetical protein
LNSSKRSQSTPARASGTARDRQVLFIRDASPAGYHLALVSTDPNAAPPS